MSTPSCVKQPSESRVYTMDFSAQLAQGEVITGVTSVAYDGPTGDTTLVISGIASYTDTTANQRISGGTSGARYDVTMIVTTSFGNTLEGEGVLQVKDL